MKTTLIALLLMTKLYALDAEAIRNIANKPHSRDNLVAELKLYPNAREYKLTAQSGKSLDKMEAGPEILVTEKTVQGRYLVSQAILPGANDPLIMVVTYQKDTGTFKKWVLLPDGVVGTSTGIADFEMRTIAWVSDTLPADPTSVAFSIERHSDEKSTWKETTVQDGKVIAIGQGVAIKTK